MLIEPVALNTLAQLCDGDARSALNGLQLAVQAKQALSQQERKAAAIHTSMRKNDHPEKETDHLTSTESNTSEDTPPSIDTEPSRKPSSSSRPKQTLFPVVTVQDVKESLQRTHLLYDRAGEEHYNIISALHKSMRGSDANASLYWLARMLCAGEDPLYVARRVVRFASEDIGVYACMNVIMCSTVERPNSGHIGINYLERSCPLLKEGYQYLLLERVYIGI